MGKDLGEYRTPPKRVLRRMGLGVIDSGRVKVIAGFRIRWWDYLEPLEPLVVSARVLRTHFVAKTEEAATK